MYAILVEIPGIICEVVQVFDTKEQANLYLRETMAATVAFANYQNQEAQFIPVASIDGIDGVEYNLIIDGELMSKMKAHSITRPPGVTLH